MRASMAAPRRCSQPAPLHCGPAAGWTGPSRTPRERGSAPGGHGLVVGTGARPAAGAVADGPATLVGLDSASSSAAGFAPGPEALPVSRTIARSASALGRGAMPPRLPSLSLTLPAHPEASSTTTTRPPRSPKGPRVRTLPPPCHGHPSIKILGKQVVEAACASPPGAADLTPSRGDQPPASYNDRVTRHQRSSTFGGERTMRATHTHLSLSIGPAAGKGTAAPRRIADAAG